MAKQVLHKHFKDIEVSTLGFGGTRWAMEEGNNERIDRKKGFALIDAALERASTILTRPTPISKEILSGSLARR